MYESWNCRDTSILSSSPPDRPTTILPSRWTQAPTIFSTSRCAKTNSLRDSEPARILRLESRLSHLATLDALTELPTRRTFQVLLGKEWERSHRYHLTLSAVMIDIDFFKQINDTYGHPAGDEVIRGVVNLLRRHCRKSDIVCRYGGEEFVVLLPETDEASAVVWAERFRQHVAEMIVPVGNAEIRVTTSLGVTEMLADMEEKAELLSLVDQCLLAAKQRGRNRVESLQSLTASGSLAPLTGLFSDSVLEGVVARDAMIPLVCRIGPDWTIERATGYLLQYRLTSVPVTDAEGNLLGIISEKDILGIAHMPEAPRRRVDEVMRANVITYDEAAPLRACSVALFVRRFAAWSSRRKARRAACSADRQSYAGFWRTVGQCG